MNQRPFNRPSSYGGRSSWRGPSRNPQPRTQNSGAGNLSGAITTASIEAAKNQALKAQANLQKPANIYRRLSEGKFQWVKAYSDLELAKQAIGKIPGKPGEALVISIVGKVDEAHFQSLRFDQDLVRFI